MKITKNFLSEVFQDTVKEFEEKVCSLGNEVELSYVDKEKFMDDAKADSLIQLQIQLGVYKNFDKEYPNFLVVYHSDKNPIMKFLGIPYKISFCYEKAKDILKPYPRNEVRAYLRQTFVHELTHIVEDDLKKEKPDLWEKCMNEVGRNEKLAHELFAESVSDYFGGKKEHEKVFNAIWNLVNNRVKKMERERMRMF